MYSNLPLPKLLEIISRIVNDSGCTVRIVDEIPVQDREIRELCLQIYELRRAAQSIAHGELGVHFENCGCMATYLKDIMDRLKAVERRATRRNFPAWGPSGRTSSLSAIRCKKTEGSSRSTGTCP